MPNKRLYVDGAPCTNGCGRRYWRHVHTSGGLCGLCYGRTRKDRKWRRERRTTKPERHPNTVLIWEMRQEMDAAGLEGCCIYCERTLAPPRLIVCAEPECQRLYNSDWKRGKALVKRQQQAA